MAKVTRKPGKLETFKAASEAFDKLAAYAGWFSSSKYPDGTPVAYVATVHEFGDPESNIPSRSFQRVAVNKYSKDWSVLLANGARKALKGEVTAKQVLDGLGLQVAGDIRTEIARGDFEAIKDSTKRARARRRNVSVEAVNTDPLRDTNVMVNTLANQTAAKGSIG
jgi:hypothetical protein